MKQKGFLTIIGLIIVAFIIAILAVIVLRTKLFPKKVIEGEEEIEDIEYHNLPEVPQQVEEELKGIQEGYENKIKD